MPFVIAALIVGVLLVPVTGYVLLRLGRPTGARILFATSAIHVSNDACFALLYPLLPFVAADLDLSYTQVGLIKAAFSGTSSAFQMPAAWVGERLGEYAVLLLGNLWVGVGLGGMALATNYAFLLVAAILAGLGGSAQHPLAPALVARAYDPRGTPDAGDGGRESGVGAQTVPCSPAPGPAAQPPGAPPPAPDAEGDQPARRIGLATALGTLNFAGDLGKLVGPLIVALVAPVLGWQAVLAGFGACTAVYSLGLLWQLRAVPVEPERITDHRSRSTIHGPRSTVPEAQVSSTSEATEPASGRRAGEVPPSDGHAATTAPSGSPSPLPRTAVGGRRSAVRGPWSVVRGPFAVLLLAGALDNATRSASLTLLPFWFGVVGLDAAAVSTLRTTSGVTSPASPSATHPRRSSRSGIRDTASGEMP